MVMIAEPYLQAARDACAVPHRVLGYLACEYWNGDGTATASAVMASYGDAGDKDRCLVVGLGLGLWLNN